MSLLPDKPTPANHEIGRIPILIYGPPKIGKSTLASQFPKALFLPFEAGLSHLDVHRAPPEGIIGSWKQFLAIAAEIAKGEHDFETIVLDTVDGCWSLCEEHTCTTRGIEYLGDMDRGKGWSIAGNEFQRVIVRLTGLGYGVVMISHSRTLQDERRGITRTTTTLGARPHSVASRLADVILFANVHEAKGPDGKIVERRALYTKPSIYHEAGDRTGRLPEILPMSYDAIQSAFSKGVEQKGESESESESKSESKPKSESKAKPKSESKSESKRKETVS